jgi:hypothetical protein
MSSMWQELRLAAEDGGLGRKLLRATWRSSLGVWWTKCYLSNGGREGLRATQYVHSGFLHFETDTWEEGWRQRPLSTSMTGLRREGGLDWGQEWMEGNHRCFHLLSHVPSHILKWEIHLVNKCPFK